LGEGTEKKEKRKRELVEDPGAVTPFVNVDKNRGGLCGFSFIFVKKKK